MLLRTKSLVLLCFFPLLLGGCAAQRQQPSTAEIVEHGRDAVTIRAEWWLDAQEAAARYCRRFRRTWLTIGRQPAGEDQADSLYDFDCVTTHDQ